MDWLLIVLLIPLAFTIYMMYRNMAVFNYRDKLRRLVFDERPGEKPGAYLKRLEHYESVSYDEMMIKFWKPLSSFYDEERFK